MDRKKNFTAGFLRENPVFSLYLGLCSTLAITTTLNNAIGMGVAGTRLRWPWRCAFSTYDVYVVR